MKTTTQTALTLSLAFSLGFGFTARPASAQATDWKKLPSPTLKAFTIPQPERVVLKNGIVVLLIEDHELPLIELSARIRTGSRLEAAGKLGLAGMTGDLLRTGGAGTRSGDDIDDFLDARGAGIESGIGIDSGNASLSCLKSDFPEVLGVFADILRQPRFDEAKIKVSRSQAKSGIARRNDDPMGIMNREAAKLVWGAGSPYARTTEYATIDAITRDDMVAFHRKYFVPNRMILGVSGDFDSKSMKVLLEKAFGDWAKEPGEPDPEAAYQKTPKPGFYRIVKNDMTQSDVILASAGIRQDNPDYYAVTVMNEVLSGSFASRLFSTIRTAKGLAYSVRGGVGAGFDRPGLFTAWLTTKTESTGAALESLLAEVDGISTRPATDDEVKRAKESILNSFIFNYDSTAKILNQQITYTYFGYPLDFLAKFRGNIEKVTAADVARVAKTYVKKNELAVLVVGKTEGVDKPLESWGKVTPIDITIPESAKPAAAAGGGTNDPAAAMKGAALLAKAIDAAGGAAVIDGIKTMRVVGQLSMQTPQGAMELKGTKIYAFPDRIRNDIETPMGAMSIILTPKDAFMAGAMGVRDLPESRKGDMMKDMNRDVVVMFQHRKAAGFTALSEGTADAGAIKADVLAVTIGGETTRYLVDPATGNIVQVRYRGEGPGGAPGDIVSTLSDFRKTSGGLTLPFKSSRSIDGEEFSSSGTTDVAVNEPVDDSQFARPAGGAGSGNPPQGGGN